MSTVAEKIAKIYPTGDVYGLRFYASDDVMSIKVFYKNDRSSENYIVNFMKMYNKLFMEKTSMDEEHVYFCNQELELKENFLMFVVNHFKQILLTHNETIEHLSLLGPEFSGVLKDYDFNIEVIKNLNSICLESSFDIPNLLAKIDNQLQDLCIYQEETSENLAYIEKIYKIKKINIEYLKLNGEQLFKLAATRANINIGMINEMDIYNFIQSWKNGSSKRNVEFYEWWYLEDTTFDKAKLFRRFGKSISTFQRQHIKVEICQQKGTKTAQLILKRHVFGEAGKHRESLQFIVNTNDHQ